MLKLLVRALLGVLVAVGAPAAPLVPGDILVSIFDQGIFAVNPDTGIRTLIAAGTYADFSIAPSGEIYALTGRGGAPDAAVVRIDPLSGSVQPVSSGGLLVRAYGVTANQHGIFVLNRHEISVPQVEWTNIVAIDSATGAQTLLVEGLGAPRTSGSGKSDLESDSEGSLFATISLSDNLLVRVDPRTGEFESILGERTFYQPTIGLGIGEYEDETFWLATIEDGSEGLWKVDADGEISGVINANSIDVDVERSGSLIVAGNYSGDYFDLCPDEAEYCLVRFDPETRQVLRVFDDIIHAYEVQVVPSTIPEPSTGALLVLGLAMLRRARRR